MKIYTKTGDEGTTALRGGKRVSKSHFRIKTYGGIDEVNSILGIILANKLDDDLRLILTKIQNELFVAGADLSNPNLNDKSTRISSELINFLEEKIDELEKELSPISNFILPGGTNISAHLHLARTVTRRTETLAVELSEREPINKNCIKYLNRLSDLLFVIARVINKRNKTPDIVWKP